ncbi:hypothetical protein GUJ93_ZPchr0013g37343 [Zizania palustris]|uniref:Uncharacterized protein n=1 Tax=Zizania palustris TaxID=103762 RepID=A0A8J6BW16_ZIZPA|nr:hypothetical protein GUJ93_ZPchr0013g37343 [Zizania palustris]
MAGASSYPRRPAGRRLSFPFLYFSLSGDKNVLRNAESLQKDKRKISSSGLCFSGASADNVTSLHQGARRPK